MSDGGKPVEERRPAPPEKQAAKTDPPAAQEQAAGQQLEEQGGRQKHGANEDRSRASRRRPPHKHRGAIIITSAVVILMGAGGALYYLHARQYESTDDAYIDGHVTQISPQVPAPVLRLHIDDNELMERGELLTELDPTDYNVALMQAQAQLAAAQGRLAQSRAQVGASKAAVEQASAQVDIAQVSLENATRDLRRYEQVDPRARSREQLDNVTTSQRNSQAQLQDALARKASAEANVTTSEAAVLAAEGDVKTSEAALKRAQVNLSYCRIFAPTTGRVTQRTIEAGTYVQTGQAMFALVAPDVWVTANFKETQLTHMRPGQPVTIKVDAFPDIKFNGHVDSIQAGSGSRFSVLPAENATGNFVKVVQRVPVKILFDHGPNLDDGRLLSPGLSVIPSVKVR